MGYDTPTTETYFFPSSAFGATTETQTHKGPKGKVGLVIDIETDLTADCVGTTTVPEINVGTASGDFTYARHRLGTTATAGNTAAATPHRASSLAAGSPPVKSDFTGHVALETARIPADTAFVITRLAGVGGTPAGTGRSFVKIKWF